MNTTIIVGFCVVFGLLTLFTFVVPLLMAYVAYKTVSVSGGFSKGRPVPEPDPAV